MAQTPIEIEKIVLDARKRLTMSGVSSVDGFSEQVINLTVAGSKVKIVGENIKITSFNKGTGNLTADGCFTEIKYSTKKLPLLKRLFK